MAGTSLVTGGNGFVGCHVVRALVQRGDHVRVLVGPARTCARLRELIASM